MVTDHWSGYYNMSYHMEFPSYAWKNIYCMRLLCKFPDYPMAAYHVSGECMMLNKCFDESNLQSAVFEVMESIKRAGADLIITYYAPWIAKWLKDD
ncbi:hypothetical protein A3Q56_05985 [Intoshia linei]|uniref:porphobilinogen synthase n=1 Tax=Intoshia linei TaxID=1819745 RepID=A0A177AWD2_9BILA|nr:hypothetical protein A3Q56_05985 [Intoshia linei]